MNKDSFLQPITSDYQCTKDNADHMRCNHLHSCQSCVTHTGCHWDTKLDVPMCTPINLSMPSDLKASVISLIHCYL